MMIRVVAGARPAAERRSVIPQMAFDDRHNERLIVIGCLAFVLAVGLPFAHDRGWSVFNVLIGVAIGVVVLLTLIGFCFGVNWVLERWTFRKQ